MAVTSEARTHWAGSLIEGSGTTTLASSGAGEFPVTWAARSEGQTGLTNPEELMGAAQVASVCNHAHWFFLNRLAVHRNDWG